MIIVYVHSLFIFLAEMLAGYVMFTLNETYSEFLCCYFQLMFYNNNY